MAKKSRRSSDLCLIMILYSNNKKSLNSISKKINFNKFSVMFHNNQTFIVSSLNLKFIKNVVLSYIKKENFYYNLFGLKYNNNFLSFDFFSCNFALNKFDFKCVILYTLIYKSLVIFYYNFILLLNLYYLVYSNLNLFFYRCLQ